MPNLREPALLSGRAAIQSDLARLEEWVSRNFWKFSNDKCKSPLLGKEEELIPVGA